MFDIKDIPLDDKNVWDLISSGNVAFCFQIESNLGRSWCKKIQPSSIFELADLISLIRPICLQTKIGDPPKNMPQIYCDRKHGLSQTEYLHSSLEPILSSTYGILIFQEQALRIAIDIAGFSGTEAETLRKGLGKKDSQIISELEVKFLEGCQKKGLVDQSVAQQLFNNIRAGQRYGFNKCLSPYTWVKTHLGFRQLNEVQIGHFINTPTGYKQIKNIYHTPNKRLVKIITEKYYDIECSLEHKFLCEDNIVRPLYEIITSNYNDTSVGGECVKIVTKEGCENIEYIDFTNQKLVDSIDIEIDGDPNNPLEHIFYANGIATSNSHAISYSMLSYATSYLKCYYPLQFFTSCLIESRSKQKPQDEVKAIVIDARTNNIECCIPNICDKKLTAYIKKGKYISFGLSNIKGVGSSAQTTLLDIIAETELELGKTLDKFSWTDFLFLVSPKINSQVIEGLIFSGALDFMKIPRSQMFFEFEKMDFLTKGELKWIVEHQKSYSFPSLFSALIAVSPKKKDGGGCHTDKKTEFVLGLAQSVDRPTLKIKDSPKFIAMMEEKYLGISITCQKSDGSVEADMANYTCEDLNNGRGSINISFVAEITRIKEHQIKKGDNTGKWMAFVDVHDKTAALSESIIIFADVWEDIRDSFDEKASYFFVGSRSKKNTIIVENLQKIC